MAYVTRYQVILMFLSAALLLTIVSLASAQDPARISDAGDLRNVSEDLNGDYVLVNDIDASSLKGFEPIGSPDEPFNGSFDGNGHEIKGLTIRKPGPQYVGLFGFTGREAEIRDLGLINLDVAGRSDLGGLVGGHEGRIIKSYVSGRVDGGGQDVGGLVGVNGGYIEESYTFVNVSGDHYVGGIAGTNNGFINKSYSVVNASGMIVGGLVGFNYLRVYESYAVGRVNAQDRSSGLVGRTGSQGRVRNSYWDVEITGTYEEITEPYGGTRLGTGEMTGEDARDSMEGFDFDGTWKSVPDNYPILRWQDEHPADPPVEGLPGFGILAGLVALIVGVYLLRRK